MHRVIPGFMCQGGDFNYANGKMGESIYGQSFRDEKFAYKHSKRGVLSMANAKFRNTNNSQFFITFAPTPWLDGKNVVFGHVVEGMEVLDEIEKVGTEGGKPIRKVWVPNCGEEDRLMLRQEALEACVGLSGKEDSTRVGKTLMEQSQKEEAQIARPEPHPYINEV
eukprot:CAMPEP_0178417774 /NCGR_PEP_ID=MMETSP0689_2-20121128/24743_1 /TAXON_ID=160604 /ORGANISM="Amphidinium massartii, Strain CS-259" /LENGTH=165 /DNA_ID=CAMNT_0020039141 /DNA_START=196 /DNA_END=689 /DNA_ORIENTATION=-